ncbi:MAG TPA: type II secretion system minor pseudopilin GspK [Desulfuromonadales bacterium]|nr:type II secretion system minor pseudopilin GspK [Desulfuromonadales bacterium]
MKRLDDERGMVLLLVLIIVALLTSLLTEFAFSTLVDLRLAETFRDGTRAAYLAKGGIKVGRIILQQDHNSFDSRDELWAQGVANYPVGDGAVSVQINDLDGRLDINRLVTTLGNPDVVVQARFKRLFSVFGLDDPEGLTDALIDWIDKDSNRRPQGAEDPYYLSLPHPYHCKNAPLDSLDELALIKGFTPAVIKAIRPYVTVHGSDKININTASAVVLESLAPQMDRDAADEIVAKRKEQPFKNIAELKQLPNMDTLYGFIYLYIDVTSRDYLIRSSALVNDGSRTIEAIVDKQGDILRYEKVF